MRMLRSALRGLRGLFSHPGTHRATATSGRFDHEGATEAYGRELHDLRDVQVAPELVTELERELEWILAFHKFEHDLRAEVDRIFAPALALAECEDFDQVRELVSAHASAR